MVCKSGRAVSYCPDLNRATGARSGLFYKYTAIIALLISILAISVLNILCGLASARVSSNTMLAQASSQTSNGGGYF